jgi:pimeloyl-ACP methyl ester carboxylesterase
MREVDLLVSGGRKVSARVFEPVTAVDEQLPGLLFVHGKESSQRGYAPRAQRATDQLGAVCLTFDLGGHGRSEGLLDGLSPRDHLLDCEVAFDALAGHQRVDPARIGISGASYGAYLAALVAGRRDVARLLLRAPALLADGELDIPLGRRGVPDPNPTAPKLFEGLAASRADVLVLESEYDEVIPHSIIVAYLRGCPRARHEVLKDAKHGLEQPAWEAAFVDTVLRWFADL